MHVDEVERMIVKVEGELDSTFVSYHVHHTTSDRVRFDVGHVLFIFCPDIGVQLEFPHACVTDSFESCLIQECVKHLSKLVLKVPGTLLET